MYAFIYSDGYSVRAMLDNNTTAGFPFLSTVSGNAWQDAINWTKTHRVTKCDIRKSEYYPEYKIQLDPNCKYYFS